VKFTDGNWLMREGVRAHFPAEVHEVEAAENALTVYAPTRAVRHRGDTLGGPLLTVRYSSPLPDVIRVQATHYAGAAGNEAGPHFPLFAESDEPVSVRVDREAKEATLTSGRLSVRLGLAPGGWDVAFVGDDGRVVTRSAHRGLGYVEEGGAGSAEEKRPDRTYLHEQLTLGVGECVYGLGERFTAFVKNGQSLDTWNRDGGTGDDQAYKCVPFYLAKGGPGGAYGVFVNHPENVAFEVATEKVSRVQFSVPGESLDYFVIYGPTPREVLEKYAALTGRPALPPAWSFGLWLTTSFTTQYDEGTVTGVLEELAARDLPLSVFHFDCFWMRAFRWCDFEWDPATFPDPAGMLRRLHERGLKVCVWINPYVAQMSPLFAEAAAQGFLLKRTDGSVWQTDLWQPGMGVVDFTHPGAREWFASKLRALADMGVDSFKTDFGERIPTQGVVWHDGSDPARMHNYYPYLYNETVFRVLEEARGAGEAALFARSATAGCQQFPVHWGGDCSSSFESMAESLRGGLSLCLSGFGFWSHDIGGFEGTPRADVYKRWIAFGLLSSHSRLHGSSSYRVPWLFDEEAVDVLRHFTRLKHRLMPYLFGAAAEAHATGVPVMRAMALEFPDDPACDTLDRQYMLGGSLLVAPVFSADGRASYYVPDGRWSDLATGREVAGGRWIRNEEHGFLSLPLLVRPGTLVPLGADGSRPDYEYGAGVTLFVGALEDGETASVTVPTLTGSLDRAFRVTRAGRRLLAEVTAGDDGRPWSLLLPSASGNGAQVEGGSAERTERGLLVTAAADTPRMEVIS
jgi:alpha-D-xyloside xylohydrolase